MTDSAITYVKVFVGKDNEGYYTAYYANGEPGPRSEGYAGGRDAAAAAANRDFPGIPIYAEEAQPQDLPPASE